MGCLVHPSAWVCWSSSGQSSTCKWRAISWIHDSASFTTHSTFTSWAIQISTCTKTLTTLTSLSRSTFCSPIWQTTSITFSKHSTIWTKYCSSTLRKVIMTLGLRSYGGTKQPIDSRCPWRMFRKWLKTIRGVFCLLQKQSTLRFLLAILIQSQVWNSKSFTKYRKNGYSEHT